MKLTDANVADMDAFNSYARRADNDSIMWVHGGDRHPFPSWEEGKPFVISSSNVINVYSLNLANLMFHLYTRRKIFTEWGV